MSARSNHPESALSDANGQTGGQSHDRPFIPCGGAASIATGSGVYSPTSRTGTVRLLPLRFETQPSGNPVLHTPNLEGE
jgi:hypothetical protein